MRAGLLDKSNSQTSAALRITLPLGPGRLFFWAKLTTDLCALPLGGRISQEAIHALRQMILTAGWPTSLSDTSESLNEVRKVQRDLSGCVILDFFSRIACHFTTLQ